MGWWGVYDDENDYVCDEWEFFISKLIKQNNTCRKLITNNLNDFIKNNTEKFNQFLLDYLNDIIAEQKKYAHYTIPGICLMVIKHMDNIQVQHQPLYGIPPSSELPYVFPVNLSEEIRILGVKCIYDSFNEIENEGWIDPIKRKKALNHELYLFSKGQEGIDEDIIQNAFQKLK